MPCANHAANVENKAARRNGLSQNPSVSTAALESGASRARYAAMGLDRGEATETFGNEPSTLISVLTTDIGLCDPSTLHRDGHFKSVATGGVVSVTPRSRLSLTTSAANARHRSLGETCTPALRYWKWECDHEEDISPLAVLSAASHVRC